MTKKAASAPKPPPTTNYNNNNKDSSNNNNNNNAIVSPPSVPTSQPSNNKNNNNNTAIKRPNLSSTPTPAKKPRLACLGTVKDVTLAEAGKYGTLNEYAFFDKVRKALKSQTVYENFLRCLGLFNEEIISRSELVSLVQPFLNKFPQLFKWFKDFVGYKEGTPQSSSPAHCNDLIPNNIVKQERISGDLAMEIGKLHPN